MKLNLTNKHLTLYYVSGGNGNFTKHFKVDDYVSRDDVIACFIDFSITTNYQTFANPVFQANDR